MTEFKEQAVEKMAAFLFNTEREHVKSTVEWNESRNRDLFRNTARAVLRAMVPPGMDLDDPRPEDITTIGYHIIDIVNGTADLGQKEASCPK